MKLLHLFCLIRTIRGTIVIGLLAGGLILLSAGLATWFGSSLPPFLALTEESSESIVRPVGRTVSESDHPAVNSTLGQAPLDQNSAGSDGADLAWHAVGLAPSLLDHLPPVYETTPNSPLADSDQLHLWGEPLATATKSSPISAEIAGRYFSRSVFQHHRTVQPLTLLVGPSVIPVQPVVVALPPISKTQPIDSVPHDDITPPVDNPLPPLIIATQESVFQ